MGDRPRLRRHLTHHHVEEDDDRQCDGERDDVTGRVRQGEQLTEHALDDASHGRFGNGTEPERAHRDAELCAGQHQRQLTKPCERVLGPLVAFGRQLLDARATRCEERELGGDEEPVQREQHDGEAETRPADLDPVGCGEHHRLAAFGIVRVGIVVDLGDPQLQTLDRESVDLEDLDLDPVDDERLADRRDVLEAVEDETRNGVVLAVGQVESR